LLDYAPRVHAITGTIVTIDQGGEVITHRGLFCEAGAKVLRTLEHLRQGLGGGGA